MTVLQICILITFVAFARGDKFEDLLYKKLMHKYNKDIRPAVIHETSMNVTFGFSLHQLIDVDEKNQVITTSSWLNINWMDYHLVWNRSEFGGLTMMHLPAEKVWRPDIILTNNADPEYKEVVVSTEVFVTDFGNVTWLAFAIFKSSCKVNVRYYPFDDQECNLTFSSWTYDVTEINLQLIEEKGDLTNFMKNGEFDLKSMMAVRNIVHYSCCTEPYAVISVIVKLKRRPLFYVFNHILPCVLITSMSLLGFYIPADTGEKVTMCITTMLSMGVFLKTVNENLPPASEAVPLIGMYYGVSLMIVCAATVVNVFTLNLHHAGEGNSPNELSPFLRKLILGYMAKAMCIKLQKVEEERFGRSKMGNRNETNRWHNASTHVNFVSLERNCVVSPKLDGTPKQLRVDSSPMGRRNSSAPPLINSMVDRRKKEKSKNRQPSPRVSHRSRSKGPTETENRQANWLASDLRREFESRFGRVLRRIHKTLEQNEIRVGIQEKRGRIMWEWKQLATICDRLLLWIFIVATAVTSILILLEPKIK